MTDHQTVTVVRTQRLTPHMQRVTLTAEDLPADYTTGIPDEYVRLLLPDDDPAVEHSRTYTIRRFDPDTRAITIDLFIHPGGIGSTWAATTKPGDHIGIGTPHGTYRQPATIAWELLVGDATALPAIGRILEERRAEHPVRAEIVVAGPDEHQQLTTDPHTTIVWHHTPDPHEITDRLRRLVIDADLPDGPGYVWVAGEAAACRDIRHHLRHVRRLPPTAYCILGYWRPDGEAWEARYDAANDTITPRIDALYAHYQGQLDDPERLEDYRDEIDQLYQQHGL